MLYAVALFLLAVILVPHQLSVVDDSWEYFLSIRQWFFGGLLVLKVLDLVDTFMKGCDWGLRQSYAWYWLAVTAPPLQQPMPVVAHQSRFLCRSMSASPTSVSVRVHGPHAG